MQSISSNITGNINADNSQSSYSWFPVGSAQAYVLANYQPRLSMGASSSTYADVEYLRSVLDMKLRLEGVNEVLGSSDAILYVLVDVLGTNRSHTEKILGFCEEYAATCELTYYAVNSAGNVFILPCQSAAISCYKEDYQFGNETPQIQRTTWAIPPMVKTPPALAMKNFSPRKETIPASTTRPADSTSSQPFSPAQPSGDSHASQRPLFQAIVQFRLW
jgi:hypothetical protein